jgi:hypothetical protein
MEEIKCQNQELSTELETLKEHQVSSVANQIDQEPQDARVDHGLLARLSLLEVQDGDAIWIGTYTFTNGVDCEAFLSAKVPAKVLSAYCYNMVLLVHRVPKNGDVVSPEAILQRDYTAHKGGFTHVGSTFIYSSMQQALPEAILQRDYTAHKGGFTMWGPLLSTPPCSRRCLVRWQVRQSTCFQV